MPTIPTWAGFMSRPKLGLDGDWIELQLKGFDFQKQDTDLKR